MFGLLTRSLTWGRAAAYDFSMKTLAMAGIAALSILVAACGGSNATTAPATSAPVESASDSGEVAGWGTKGVEATFVNPYDREIYHRQSDQWIATYRISVRGDYTGVPRTIGPGQRTTYWGDSAGSDDLEFNFYGPFKTDSSSLEVDFSNPTMGCPNATVGYDMRQFCSVGTKHWWQRDVKGAKLEFRMERLSDSDDHKRFEVYVFVRCETLSCG